MIPRVIHQLWKTDQVPAAYRHWQHSWRRLNQDYAYRLWTNRDIERLIDNDFPEWRQQFYAFRENICRIDLARYLILKKFGGVYADLDFECLRPLDALLEGHSFVAGVEPEAHLRIQKVVKSGLPEVVCNAWIASVPDHPFWDHLLGDMRESAGQADVLDSTGPFLFTRSCRSYRGGNLTLLAAKWLYPVTKDECWNGRINDLEFLEASTREAYAMHYWEGTWFRPACAHQSLVLPEIPVRWNRPSRADQGPPAASQGAGAPLISCLLISAGDADTVRRAIGGFLAQTYQNLELVIVVAAPLDTLALVRGESRDSRIRWLTLPASASGERLLTAGLGALRGNLVAIWDEAWLHDPSRLEVQYRAMSEAGAAACMLGRLVVLSPQRQALWLSARRAWPSSLLCSASVISAPVAGDAQGVAGLATRVLAAHRVLIVDVPRLLVGVVQDVRGDVAGVRHALSAGATRFYSGPACERVVTALAARVEIREAGARAVSG